MNAPILAWTLTLLGALAHEGEDHGAPAPETTSAEEGRVLTVGARFEAALALDPEGGAPRVMLADATTSAPVAEGALTLTLSGPEALSLPLQATPSAGVWQAERGPGLGSWAGALIVQAPAGSDLLPLDAVEVNEHDEHDEHDEHSAVGWPTAGALGLGLGLGLGIGVLVGRRRGAVAGLLLGGLLAAQPAAQAGGDPAPVVLARLRLALESQFVVGLRTERAQERTFQPGFRALGTLHGAPSTHADLRAPVDGTLRAPEGGWPHPGAAVRRGQVLAWVEERPAAADRAALAAARAEAAATLAQAQEALALARRDAEQAAALGEALSPRERLAREQAQLRAERQAQEAQAALDALGGGGRTAISAPFDGQLVRMDGHPADWVLAGDPVFAVQGAGGVQAELSLPTGRRVTAGAHATLRLGEQHADAVILDPGLQADPLTGLVRATALLPEPPAGWLPGLPLSAWLAEGPAREALVVPDAAVLESGGLRLAFVKTGPESFELRQLALEARDGGAWAVHSGLAPGERVVVAGAPALRGLAGR